MKQLLFSLLAALIMVGCAREDVDMQPREQKISTRSGIQDISMTADSVLQIPDEETLEDLMAELNQFDTEYNKVQFLNQMVPGFVSIQDLYNQALIEADTVNFAANGAYENFKKRHPEFYFANEDGDAGFYIPMEDQDLAYLVPASCEIIIGGVRRNYKDKNVYDKLKAKDLTYSSSQPSTSYQDYIFTPDWGIFVTTYPFEFKGKKVDPLPVQAYTESPWFYNIKKITDPLTGKTTTTKPTRKLKISARRLAKLCKKNGKKYWQGMIHFDVCFRKVNSVGYWVNYKSKTSLSVNLEEYGDPTHHNFGPYVHKGRSAHDVNINIPCHVTRSGTDYVYTYPPLEYVASVDYQGFEYIQKDTRHLCGGQYIHHDWKNPISVATGWD